MKNQEIIAKAAVRVGILTAAEAERRSLLEDFLNLYNQRESKLFEAIYILGACDAETYL